MRNLEQAVEHLQKVKVKTKALEHLPVQTTEAELKRLLVNQYHKGVQRGVDSAIALFFLILKDHHDAPMDDLKVLWAEVEKYCQEIGEGRFSIEDAITALHEDYGIVFIDGKSL